MISLVEQLAQRIGWDVGERNVIVEGTSDVELLTHARNLWLAKTGGDLFGDKFTILAAGRRDDGGVEGLVRRLTAVWQNSEADAFALGAQRHHFIGLFDNDRAGRDWVEMACKIDRRVIRYRDVFLLHPTMPPANGNLGPVVERRARSLNASCWDLDWEVEDLLSDDLHLEFRGRCPNAIHRETSRGGRTHRDLTLAGKVELRRFVRQEASVDDILDMVRLLCALRDYMGLEYSHLQP